MKHEDRHNDRNPKGKDLTLFVRFGGVNLKTQKGFGKDNFHSPPAPRGFYAMPKTVQVFFLVGSIGTYQPGTMPKEKDYKEIEKMTAEEAEAYWAERDFMKNIRRMRKEFRKADGNLWHHLGDKIAHNEIIERHGSWVKTSVKVWQKAFSKESLNNRYGDHSISRNTSLTQSRGLNGYYCQDHFEVFFDEKV